MGNILTLGYKTTLLSSLVPIRYEDTIDNIYDVDKSGLPVLILESTTVVDFLRENPRTVMQRLFHRKKFWNIDSGGVPTWVKNMYEKTE